MSQEFQAVPAPAADFSSFFLSPTTAVDIELPNGEPMLFQGKPVRIHVYGPASPEFVAAADAQQRFVSSRVSIKKGGIVKNTLMDPEEAHEQDAKFLAAVTSSVENFPFEGGAVGIYRERRLGYIADQVRAKLNDQSSFFPNKAKG